MRSLGRGSTCLGGGRNGTWPGALCLGFALFGSGRGGAQAATGATGQPRLSASYGNLPLSFEANLGQSEKPVRFLARGQGYGLFITPTEAVLSLRAPDRPPAV